MIQTRLLSKTHSSSGSCKARMMWNERETTRMFIWSHEKPSLTTCIDIRPPVAFSLAWSDGFQKDMQTKVIVMMQCTNLCLCTNQPSWIDWEASVMDLAGGHDESWGLEIVHCKLGNKDLCPSSSSEASISESTKSSNNDSLSHSPPRQAKQVKHHPQMCICRSGEKPHDENGVNLESQWDSVRRICSPVSNKSCCCRYGSAIQIQKLACARVTGPKAWITPFNKHVLAHSILFTEVSHSRP